MSFMICVGIVVSIALVLCAAGILLCILAGRKHD
jgi:hypothetical protein